MASVASRPILQVLLLALSPLPHVVLHSFHSIHSSNSPGTLIPGPLKGVVVSSYHFSINTLTTLLAAFAGQSDGKLITGTAIHLAADNILSYYTFGLLQRE